MKIIAEFNSNEELLSFVSTFSGLGITVNNIEAPKVEVKEETKVKKVTTKKQETVQAPKEEPKEETEKVEAEIIEDKKAEEELPVAAETQKALTKEDVLKASKAKMAEGKTAEVKALIEKYGAKNVSGIKEEDYEAMILDLGGI